MAACGCEAVRIGSSLTVGNGFPVVVAMSSGRERGMERMNRRWWELVAIPLVGDGMLGILIPARHVRRWLVGPTWWRDAMRPFVRRPQLTRWVGIAEVALGLWLAVRENARQSG